MAAKDHLQPLQLQMLMTGSELQNMITRSSDQYPVVDKVTGEYRGKVPMEKLWEEKEAEARRPKKAGTYRHGAGVYSSLKKDGYEGDSIDLIHADLPDPGVYLSDGHHRIAAAAALEREGREMYIPVEHH